MAENGPDLLSMEFWLPLMAGDLPEAKTVARQPVRVEGRAAKLFAGALNGPLKPGSTVGSVRRGGRIVVAEVEGGVDLPEAARKARSCSGSGSRRAGP